jgi:ABC-type microcin C transport system permease subunit YejE
MVIIGLTSWTGIARFTRAEFLRIRSLEFVQAGEALGYSATRTIFKHALPNALAPVFVSIAFGRACLNIVLVAEYPNASPACTNSKERILKNSALVNLAIPVQLVKPIITITIQMLLVTTEEIVMIKSNLGIEFKKLDRYC